MSAFECSYEEFKQRAKEFHNSIPILDREGLDNGIKALGLSYLEMYEDDWKFSARVALKIMQNETLERHYELDKLLSLESA